MIRTLISSFGLRPAEILATIPFIGGMLAAGQESALIQYGGLGVCALSVMGLFRYLNTLTKMHREEREAAIKQHYEERKELVASIAAEQKLKDEQFRNYYSTIAKITEALQDRPCVLKDKRITGKE